MKARDDDNVRYIIMDIIMDIIMRSLGRRKRREGRTQAVKRVKE